MSFRELIILLLGLAIVAVILRGLYVAIQARKGQIKLAIDKNIPQDVDLEAMELAELPGGGARVVSRENTEAASNEEFDPIERANERAEALELDRESESIPVLMDSVTLNQSELDLDNGGAASDDFEADRWQADTNDVDEAEYPEESQEFEDQAALDSGLSAVMPDYKEASPDSEETSPVSEETSPIIEEASPIIEEASPVSEESSPYIDVHNDERATEWDEEFVEDESESAESDDILLDYDTEEATGLASVQPDYPDEEEPGVAAVGYASHDDENYEGEYSENSADQGEESFEEDQADSGFDPSLNDGMDDFSMTAGDRIGFHPQASTQSEASEFDETEPPITVKRKSLFTALRNKISQSLSSSNSDDQIDDELSDEELAEFSDNSFEYSDSYSDETDIEANEYQGGEFQGELLGESLDESIDETEDSTTASSSQSNETAATATAIRQHQPSVQAAEIKQQSTTSQPSEVLVLNVMAEEGREFHGDELMHAVITSGLKFGEMNIFHYRYGNDSNGPVIFSLANILNPGTFDLNNMAEFSTIGVSMFLALPAASNNYDAFEHMLEVAQQLCSLLDGELKDDHRNVMTVQTIEHYRQRVRDFELRQLKAAGSRG